MALCLHINEFPSFNIMLLHHIQHIHHHRVNHVAVVIVHVEVLSVTIEGISLVPVVLETVDAINHPLNVAFTGELKDCRLYHRSKQQPVVLSRLDAPCKLQSGNEIVLDLLRRFLPELHGSAKHSLRKIGGINKRLTLI